MRGFAKRLLPKISRLPAWNWRFILGCKYAVGLKTPEMNLLFSPFLLLFEICNEVFFHGFGLGLA